MKYFLFCLIAFASFAIGTFGFAQIVGSLRAIRIRGIGMTLFTTILWASILGGVATAVLLFIPQYQIALYIGYAVSFVIILCQKNIN